MGILACPTCDSRYDITGYPAGQQFRCRCGTVTTLQAQSPTAGVLACPHCGAGVSSTETACSHCASELLLKGCPRCLSRVFHGHKHCPQCGAGLEQAASGTPTELACPRCDKPLHARRVGEVVIDECAGCLGLFLDHVAIQRVVTDRAQARAEALLGALPHHAPGRSIDALPPAGGRMYIKCPHCRTVMNRKQFATGADVIVDVCRAHGTFFDVGELPAIIEFVMQGGLEKAQKKDLRRLRDEAREERTSAQYAQMQAGHSSHGSGLMWGTESRGAALIDLLGALFG